MPAEPIQHQYAEELSYCYGCGRNNPQGLGIQSFWDGEQALARFTPRPEHIALPGYVYGGLLASLIDCHGVGTAAAAAAHKQPDQDRLERYVTASLHVDFLKPTTMGRELELRGRVNRWMRRKIVVDVEILIEGEVCVRGEVVAAPMPQTMAHAAA